MHLQMSWNENIQQKLFELPISKLKHSQCRQKHHNKSETIYKRLKTLFNIVEGPFKKLLNFDVCVV